jgi:hypothetical protein
MRWTKLGLTCIYFLKNKLTHHCFKSSPSICMNWIDRVDFLHIFDPIRFASVQLASSPPFSLPGAASPTIDVATSYHASFPLSQDELAASTSSFGNALSRYLPSRVETKALNLHHCCRLPSPDHPTITLHCYKRIISTLATLSVTQSRLHFASP